MIRYFVVWTFCLLTVPAFSHFEEATEEFFLSTPEQVATLKSETSYLIGGLINPLSGHPALRQTDLIVKGSQNIILTRTYIPPSVPCSFPKHKHNQGEWDKLNLCRHVIHNYKGWQFYPHLKLLFTSSSKEILLTDPNGACLNFRLSGPNYSITTLVSPPYALSNTAGETPSGKYDPRNTRISYEKSGNKISVYATDGAVFYYYKKGASIHNQDVYFLEKEILPNGKILKYHYSDRGCPDYVESLDPKERFVYASIRISGSPWKNGCHFASSTGMTADYSYQQKNVHVEMKEKEKHWYGDGERKTKYNFLCPPTLSSVSSPSYRCESLEYTDKFLLSSYKGKEEVFTVQLKGFGEGVQHYRVHKLLLPVGQKDSFIPVYEFFYQPPVAGEKEGTTTVKNIDGSSVIYHFSKNLLTTAIQYFGQDGSLKKEKVFFWDEKNWLKALEMRDGHKNVLHRKSYEYDRFGNPILEMFTGDLKGEGNQETFTTKKTYSEDGRNLILSEKKEDGPNTLYTYLPNTNLLTSKTVKDGDKTLLQEIYDYDDYNNLIRKTIDDGIEYRITEYVLRDHQPFLHMPEWIIEKYIEDNIEKALKKIHLSYDNWGNVCEESIYGSDGLLAYTLTRTYNERGDLLTETNALGQEAFHKYDDRGRCYYSQNFSHLLEKNHTFDTQGRLCKLEEVALARTHTTLFDYDPIDRLIQKTDFLGNQTNYVYEPFLNEPSKTLYPPISSTDVITSATYDALGNRLTDTDAKGLTTTFRYNAYCSPIFIQHPSGGIEIFQYYKNGKLKTHTDADNLATTYVYDALDNLLTKSTPFSQETYIRSALHLLSYTDSENYITTYIYDKSGRKKTEEKSGRLIEWAYDPLGRISTLIRYNSKNTLCIHYGYDLLDRLKEEIKTDLSGNLLFHINYTYDKDGNRDGIIRSIQEKESQELFTYDPFQRLVEIKDPLGYITQISYPDKNPFQKITTDPKKVKTIVTQDAHGNTIKKEIFNPRNKLISSQEYIYDPCSNLLEHHNHIFEGTIPYSTQFTVYTYSLENQIESLIRGFGTPDTRTTTYIYTPGGKLSERTLPNGTVLRHTYHPLGHLEKLTSSDEKIHHTFDYNTLGQLREATDHVLHASILRELDPFGNILSETFNKTHTIHKTYDALNRPLILQLPDASHIIYDYDPLYLRSVTRGSYTHTYNTYDLSGNLCEETLLTHTYDLKGRRTYLSSPHIHQECRYDEVDNLYFTSFDNKSYTYTYDDLSQLASESSPFLTHHFDSNYNPVSSSKNDLNELLVHKSIECKYDLNGNQSLKGSTTYIHDPLNRLISATTPTTHLSFTYDPLNRRLSKTSGKLTEYYIYDDHYEIASLNANGTIEELRIPGLELMPQSPASIAFEIDHKLILPIQDIQGNLRLILDSSSKPLAAYNYTAFGQELTSPATIFIPWRYASKRFDPELNLLYFGHRYYDPFLGRWLSADPAGFVDSYNLYQYLLNNPFRYTDPDGQFLQFAIPLLVWGAEVALPALSAYATPIIYGAVAGAIGYGGYKMAQALNARDDGYSPADDYAEYSMRFDASCEEDAKKKYNTNPFDGPVSDEVFAIDSNGNVIKVPQGHQLEGTRDGKWIQVKDGDGAPTGERKDGGGHAREKDIRGREPHSHVPGVSNSDGTPWLPIKK